MTEPSHFFPRPLPLPPDSLAAQEAWYLSHAITSIMSSALERTKRPICDPKWQSARDLSRSPRPRPTTPNSQTAKHMLTIKYYKAVALGVQSIIQRTGQTNKNKADSLRNPKHNFCNLVFTELFHIYVKIRLNHERTTLLS